MQLRATRTTSVSRPTRFIYTEKQQNQDNQHLNFTRANYTFNSPELINKKNIDQDRIFNFPRPQGQHYHFPKKIWKPFVLDKRKKVARKTKKQAAIRRFKIDVLDTFSFLVGRMLRGAPGQISFKTRKNIVVQFIMTFFAGLRYFVLFFLQQLQQRLLSVTIYFTDR